MHDGKLGPVESRFADIVWREGPLQNRNREDLLSFSAVNGMAKRRSMSGRSRSPGTILPFPRRTVRWC